MILWMNDHLLKETYVQFLDYNSIFSKILIVIL